MDYTVYIASDNSEMDLDDVTYWLKYKFWVEKCPLSFEDVTGGASNFQDEKAYFHLKATFDVSH